MGKDYDSLSQRFKDLSNQVNVVKGRIARIKSRENKFNLTDKECVQLLQTKVGLERELRQALESLMQFQIEH